jgi:hypothetical protein
MVEPKIVLSSAAKDEGIAASKPMKVLFIDSIENSQHLAAALQRQGFDVLQTPDCNDGLEKARGGDLALIILGNQKCRDDGKGLIALLRNVAQVPVVLMLSDSSITPAETRSFGADVHFSLMSPAESLIQYTCARLGYRKMVRNAA